MTIEKYYKRQGGKLYYNIYYRYGHVLVQVEDIKAASQEEAIEKANSCIKKAFNSDPLVNIISNH